LGWRIPSASRAGADVGVDLHGLVAGQVVEPRHALLQQGAVVEHRPEALGIEGDLRLLPGNCRRSKSGGGPVAASKADKVPAEVGESVHGYATWLTTKARQIIAG